MHWRKKKKTVAKWNPTKIRKGLMIPALETLRKTAQHSTTEQGKPIFVNHCLIDIYTAGGPPLTLLKKKFSGHSQVCQQIFAWWALCLSHSETYLLQLLSNLFLEIEKLTGYSAKWLQDLANSEPTSSSSARRPASWLPDVGAPTKQQGAGC